MYISEYMSIIHIWDRKTNVPISIASCSSSRSHGMSKIHGVMFEEQYNI